jgi:hypothetical protein
MSWKFSVAAPFLFVMLFLTSCVAPIAAPVPAANNAKMARYVAEAAGGHAINQRLNIRMRR